MRLLYVVSDDKYFCSHRLALAKEALAKGYHVAVATTYSSLKNNIQKEGIEIFPLKYFHRSRLSPWSLYKSCRELTNIHKIFRPDIVHNVGLKLALLGSLSAWEYRKIPVINTLGGLGHLFTFSSKDTWKKCFHKSSLRTLIKGALWIIARGGISCFVVQNQDDREILQKLVPWVTLIPGSGVSLKDYPSTPFPSEPPINVVCVTRLLKDKGVREFVEAARLIKKAHPSTYRFILYGQVDPHNPSSLTEQEARSWVEEGAIEWQGFCENIGLAYSQAHIAVLPSYREGLPKSLLEAASCARPIVTTDVPGCRDVVTHYLNGLLVPPADSHFLALAILQLGQNPLLRQRMGQAGHRCVQEKFEEGLIHQQTLALYDQLLSKIKS